jgi:hypothetical protein
MTGACTRLSPFPKNRLPGSQIALRAVTKSVGYKSPWHSSKIFWTSKTNSQNGNPKKMNQKSGLFTARKTHHPTHHNPPPKHHNFTTKNHTKTHAFSTTPTKKRP